MKAFPRNIEVHDGLVRRDWVEDGMELRDYFAAKAMQSFINVSIDNLLDMMRAENFEDTIMEFITVVSYRYADQMMEARND